MAIFIQNCHYQFRFFSLLIESAHLERLARAPSGLCRALVRAGATGARAPAEIWQRVQGTRPDKGAILVNSKRVLQNLR